MNIYEAFEIDINGNELVCFVGAGGKTTTMFMLAKELKRCGKEVLVTTTTSIYYPDDEHYDRILVGRSVDCDIVRKREKGSILVFGKERSSENKLCGVDKNYLELLYERKIFDHILVEADGAKRRPVKAPDFYEPVIPGNATKNIGVVGLDALGKYIDQDYVHRPELFCKVTGATAGNIIDESAIARLIISKDGLFKLNPSDCKRYVLLNKSEDEKTRESALCIIDSLKKEQAPINRFIIGSMINGTITDCL